MFRARVVNPRWMTAMRLVRSQVIAVKSSDYVAAARAMGASDFRILVRHILPNAVAPVLVGSAAAWNDELRWGAFAAALLGSIFIQIGTNLANDYYDFVRGGDTDERVGPTRVTQAGLIAPDSGIIRFGSRCVVDAARDPGELDSSGE